MLGSGPINNLCSVLTFFNKLKSRMSKETLNRYLREAGYPTAKKHFYRVFNSLILNVVLSRYKNYGTIKKKLFRLIDEIILIVPFNYSATIKSLKTPPHIKYKNQP